MTEADLARELILIPELQPLAQFCRVHSEVFSEEFEIYLEGLAMRVDKIFLPGVKQMLAFVRHGRRYGLASALLFIMEAVKNENTNSVR